MQALRKHPWIFAPLGVMALLTGLLLWRGGGTEAALVMQQGYDPIGQADRDDLLSVLKDVDLTHSTLVALNLTSQQAESVLADARTWWETNRSTLDTLWDTIHAKRHAVKVIEKQIAMGPYEAGRDAELALARQELATAQASYTAALVPLETEINAELSQSQRDTWTIIRTGHGSKMPYRMLDLNDSQRLALSEAFQVYRRQLATAGTAQQRADVVATLETTIANILATDQENVVDAYNGYYASSSAAVADAYETVLPPAGGA